MICFAKLFLKNSWKISVLDHRIGTIPTILGSKENGETPAISQLLVGHSNKTLKQF